METLDNYGYSDKEDQDIYEKEAMRDADYDELNLNTTNTIHMKLCYFSDLHLEFIRPHKLEKFLYQMKLSTSPPSDEICILAGDIGNPSHPNQHYDKFMKHISQCFKKTFVIAGNHEYYHDHHTMQETNDILSTYFQQFDNISFLNNSYEQYENHCFVGTTLWSHISDPCLVSIM